MPTMILVFASHRNSSPTSTSPPAPPVSPRARCASTRGCSTISTPRSTTCRSSEGQVVAQTAPQCFDISLWQLVSALLVGGRTLIVEQEVILDVQRFVDKIIEGRVAVLQVVPSYLEVVLSYLELHPRELPDLRCVSVTGEALKKELTQRWFAVEPGIKLVNAYGLTETSDDTNHEVMDRVPTRDRVPLGRPVNNVHLYVVDEQLSPVPLGAPGAIVFSGVCVGRGYVNDPDRTRLAYLTDPHREGQRLYCGGDYGRWLPEGKLEFLGRRDSQVKISGFRIEIGEIENALLSVPGVRDGAVVVAERADQSKHLVAFYSSRQPLDVDLLQEGLGRSLPEYMVPAVFHWRESLPLTANSKIDKKKLAATARELAVGHGGPPRARHADRGTAGCRLEQGARHPPGPDRPAGPLLRPGRHVPVGSEAGPDPGPGGVAQGRDPQPGAGRSGRGLRRTRAAVRGAAVAVGTVRVGIEQCRRRSPGVLPLRRRQCRQLPAHGQCAPRQRGGRLRRRTTRTRPRRRSRSRSLPSRSWSTRSSTRSAPAA